MLVIAETSWAQEADVEDVSASEAPPTLANQPTNEAAAPTSSAGVNHALSNETSSRVVAGLPKYLPPRAKEKSDEASPDLRETDKPKNGIIRLPRYHVREQKLPNFKNRELLTPKGKLDLAFKRRPGLKVGNIFGLNSGIAMAMLAEDEAYERKLEMAELSSFTAWIDKVYPVNPKTGQRTEAGISEAISTGAAGNAAQSETENAQK